MKKLVLLLSALVLTLAVADPPIGASGPERGVPFPEIPRITAKQTKALLGDPDVAIIDVRLVEEWRYSDQMISQAVHEDPMDMGAWAHKYKKDHTVILY